MAGRFYGPAPPYAKATIRATMRQADEKFSLLSILGSKSTLEGAYGSKNIIDHKDERPHLLTFMRR